MKGERDAMKISFSSLEQSLEQRQSDSEKEKKEYQATIRDLEEEVRKFYFFKFCKNSKIFFNFRSPR